MYLNPLDFPASYTLINHLTLKNLIPVPIHIPYIRPEMQIWWPS